MLRVGDSGVQVQLLGSREDVFFSGAFALDILSFFTAEKQSVQRLQFIEKQHLWLQGLSQATVVLRDGYKLLLGQSLGMLFVELTSQCNEKCIHCYADSAPERTDFLQTDEIKQILREARALGMPDVQFTGGDPLIHRDLLEIIQFAYHLDFSSIEIYTNGLLLTQALLDKLQPFQPKIAFSLYSHMPETHDMITRVAGSHQRTCAAIRRAVASGFQTRVSVIQMKENAGQEKLTRIFLEGDIGLKSNQIKFHVNRDIGRGEAFSPEPLKAETSSQKGTSNHYAKPLRVNKKINANEGEKVRLGKLCVSATGDVFPCVFSRNNSLGNIKKAGLVRVLQDLQEREFAQPSLARWKSCKDQLSCGDCQVVTYMMGG